MANCLYYIRRRGVRPRSLAACERDKICQARVFAPGRLGVMDGIGSVAASGN